MSTYTLIIAASVLIILSYFYNLLSKRFNIPSVLMLIITGIFISQVMSGLSIGRIDWFPYLEVLGIVGLIMIVLEAALDLKLQRDKLPVIGKSFLIALVGLLIATELAAGVIYFIIPGFDWLTATIYATPLSILSSAIIIPSVENLTGEKREFSVYESTFSDILGIMLFYFLLSLAGPESSTEAIGGFFTGLVITIFISAAASYGLIYIFQNIKTQVKTFLLIAILILLYAIGKQLHLSSLIIILVFGLVISNSHLFFPGFLKKTIKSDSIKALYKDLHTVTGETAFIVRTFFFIIFGITIVLSSLLSIKVILVSVIILGTIYGLRLAMFKLFIGKDIFPTVYIAPRGLITVLLFFAIPAEMQVSTFESGILLFIIIATSIIMTWAMLKSSKMDVEDEVLEMLSEAEAEKSTSIKEGEQPETDH